MIFGVETFFILVKDVSAAPYEETRERGLEPDAPGPQPLPDARLDRQEAVHVIAQARGAGPSPRVEPDSESTVRRRLRLGSSSVALTNNP